MGKKVYANGMEIAHKAGDGKVVAAFPDVCLSPPSPPAGPIPVPYPDTSKASDLQNGSTTVVIGGKPAALYGQSYLKTSPLGDEAATRSFGGSVITHGITGKTYFQAHSMNVKFEGKFVCRHLDITTSNHSSDPGSTPPFPNLEGMSTPNLDKKREAKWGHKRGPKRHDCKGAHDWQCHQAECPDCWEPPCQENAEETQGRYAEQQSGTPEERAAKGMAANQRKIDKDNDVGAATENGILGALDHARIEHVGYKAHCSRCHMIADIDIVTKDAVIEVKTSTKALKLVQMKENIIPVAQKCFPEKKLLIAVPKSQVAKAKRKLLEKEWTELGIKVLDL